METHSEKYVSLMIIHRPGVCVIFFKWSSIPLGVAAAAVAVRSYGVLAFACKRQ